MAGEKIPKLKRLQQSSLETANQMYKDAWLVKRTKFQKAHPELSARQIDEKTSAYFAKLKDR